MKENIKIKFFYNIQFIHIFFTLFIAYVDGNIVISPPSGWLEYDCQSKKGIVGLRWTSSFGQLDLASMKIDLSTREQKYQWQINSKEIELMSKNTGLDGYSLGALGRAFSVIPDNAIYVSTTSLKT
jgi:hypothetical protein